MCLIHNWVYIGWVHTWKWSGGMSGGIKDFAIVQAKQCTECSKVKEI